tara:strand:+ start:104 stop:328 length:225 start_codon:yes stop_codon:yes gene_type:complete
MDKYTKTVLTIIAIGIIGINVHLFGGKIISKAEAYPYLQGNYNELYTDHDLVRVVKMIITRQCGVTSGGKIGCR